MTQMMHYAKLLELGKISRREFVGRAVALGATVAVATTLAGKALRASTPRKGGHLKVGQGHGSTTDSLDPATYENSTNFTINCCLRNQLTEIREGG